MSTMKLSVEWFCWLLHGTSLWLGDAFHIAVNIDSEDAQLVPTGASAQNGLSCRERRSGWHW